MSRGVVLVILAYLIWGFFPLYFKRMESVSPLDTLAFRTLFALLSVLPPLFLFGKGREFLKQLKRPKHLLMLFTSAILVSLNWLIFIVLVYNGHTLQSSLGYYINPLITVLLALIFFRERFGKLKWTSIGIASLGVLIFAIGAGTFPWGAFGVAITFGLYGLMKKISPTDALTSLSVETLLLSPIIIVFILWNRSISHVMEIGPEMFLWLFGCGALTSLTLIIYGAGAQRVKLSTLGICQYITPSMQFLCAVIIFREPMLRAQWYCFALIWIALILFSIDSLRSEKKHYKNVD